MDTDLLYRVTREDEAKLIALLTDQEAIDNGLTPQLVYATDVTGDAVVSYQDHGMILKSTQEGSYTVTANNGQIDKIATKNIQEPFTVGEWNLQINSLEKNKNGSIYFMIPSGKNWIQSPLPS